MKAEDGTGSRHALVVLKEMWIVTHLFHSSCERVTSVARFFYTKKPVEFERFKNDKVIR